MWFEVNVRIRIKPKDATKLNSKLTGILGSVIHRDILFRYYSIYQAVVLASLSSE